jgi:hypothetical protein
MNVYPGMLARLMSYERLQERYEVDRWGDIHLPGGSTLLGRDMVAFGRVVHVLKVYDDMVKVEFIQPPIQGSYSTNYPVEILEPLAPDDHLHHVI